MRGFLVLVAVWTICSVVVADKSAQDKISDYLDEHVKTDDVEANFAGLESYLAELNQKTHLFGSARVDIIKKILRLKDASCTWEGFKAYDALARSTDFITGRLGELIKNIKQRHEDICFDELKFKVEQEIADLRPGRKAKVDEVTDIPIKYIKLDHPEDSFTELLKKNIVTTRKKKYYQEMYDFALKRDEKSDEQLSIVELIKTYVLADCEVYLSYLRPYIEICTRVLGSSSKTDEKFNENLYRYHICKGLREERHSMVSMIKEIR